MSGTSVQGNVSRCPWGSKQIRYLISWEDLSGNLSGYQSAASDIQAVPKISPVCFVASQLLPMSSLPSVLPRQLCKALQTPLLCQGSVLFLKPWAPRGRRGCLAVQNGGCSAPGRQERQHLHLGTLPKPCVASKSIMLTACCPRALPCPEMARSGVHHSDTCGCMLGWGDIWAGHIHSLMPSY